MKTGPFQPAVLAPLLCLLNLKWWSAPVYKELKGQSLLERGASCSGNKKEGQSGQENSMRCGLSTLPGNILSGLTVVIYRGT
jgi:hypothetical protein